MPDGFDQWTGIGVSGNDDIRLEQGLPVIERHIALLLVNTVVALVTTLGENRADLVFEEFDLFGSELFYLGGSTGRQGSKEQDEYGQGFHVKAAGTWQFECHT